MVVGLFFTLVGLLMFVVLPEANVGPVNQLFGAMATGFGNGTPIFLRIEQGKRRQDRCDDGIEGICWNAWEKKLGRRCQHLIGQCAMRIPIQLASAEDFVVESGLMVLLTSDKLLKSIALAQICGISLA